MDPVEEKKRARARDEKVAADIAAIGEKLDRVLALLIGKPPEEVAGDEGESAEDPAPNPHRKPKK